jgi:hypothetical protein
MHHDDQSDNIKLLLVDSMLIEEAFFVNLKNSFLKLDLNLLNFVFYVFKSKFPSLSLLFLELFFFLKEVAVPLPFIFSHLFIRF